MWKRKGSLDVSFISDKKATAIPSLPLQSPRSANANSKRHRERVASTENVIAKLP
jgi:hypothetical protein